ncbi:vacuolar ATPase assembly protein VMA22 [Rhinoraja longicauda]
MGSELEVEPELGSVCRRLDQRLLRYLEDVERLGERREQLERLMEQGWFSLSKARYSMGSKLVSSLQYGPEMVALARVDVSQKQDGHHGFSIKRVDSSEVEAAGLNEAKNLEIEEIGPKVLTESPQVRQRKRSRWEQAGVEEEWRDPASEGAPSGFEERARPARGRGSVGQPGPPQMVRDSGAPES